MRASVSLFMEPLHSGLCLNRPQLHAAHHPPQVLHYRLCITLHSSCTTGYASHSNRLCHSTAHALQVVHHTPTGYASHSTAHAPQVMHHTPTGYMQVHTLSAHFKAHAQRRKLLQLVSVCVCVCVCVCTRAFCCVNTVSHATRQPDAHNTHSSYDDLNACFGGKGVLKTAGKKLLKKQTGHGATCSPKTNSVHSMVMKTARTLL
jgi:hypothetical protein